MRPFAIFAALGAMKLATVLTALCLAACVTPDPNPFPPNTGAVFEGEHARELVNQCSRREPGPVEGVWTPTPDQIDRLERSLPSAFAEAARRDWPRETLSVIDYYRQYGGLIISGRRIIYVSAGHRSLAERTIGGRYAGRTWRDLQFMVCDGGPIVFGVEYDPQTKSFEHFAFNGAID